MVERLVAERYPVEAAYLSSPGGGSNNSHVSRASYVEGAKKHREKLSSLAVEDLRLLIIAFENKKAELAAKRVALDLKKAQEAEESRFFNQPSAEMNVSHWSRMSLWTLDEAVALSFGKEPRRVNWEYLKSLVRVSPFAIEYEARLMIVMRAKAAGQLWDSTIPGVFLAWADRMQFEMPNSLRDAIQALGIQIADWKARYDRLKVTTDDLKGEQEATIKELQSEITRLSLPHEQGRSDEQNKEKSLGARERESMLKLIIGMATGFYGYDPKPMRSDKIKEIADDLARNGIPLDPDTVRKYLYEARDLLPLREAD